MNVGFIGCGKISHYHADVLRYLKINIISASDINQQNLNIFQKKYFVKSSYESWQEMLKNEKLDAIWVTASWDIIDKKTTELLKYKTGMKVVDYKRFCNNLSIWPNFG